MTALSATAWYVYAIVPAGVAAPGGEQAILPGASLAVVSGDAAAAGLAALVSPVARALFALDDPAGRAAEPDWVAARAAAHHEVVARVYAEGSCLPLGFGTLFGSVAGVQAWLALNVARFTTALAQVAGRQEWGVTLCEDREAHAAWLRAHDDTVAALAAAAACAGPGTGFLLARRIDRAVDSARSAHAALMSGAVVQRLECSGSVLAETPPRGAVAAWSVLVPPGAALTALLAELNCAAAKTGLALRATGPWPPYAFARAAWQGGLHG
jgi:hypothetical protein